MTRSFVGVTCGIAVAVFLPLLVSCSREEASEPLARAADDTPGEHALKHTDPTYRCPMHPDVVSDEPGDCPICGMDLVEVAPVPLTSDAGREPLYYRHPHDPARRSAVPVQDEMGMDYVPVFAAEAGPEVLISPAVVNNLGVRTVAAAVTAVPQRVETVGYVDYDERRVRQVRSRAEGWIEGLAVRAVGDTVKTGQLLFRVYSPTLETAQQEYLDALSIGNDELVAASRERLRALGIEAGTVQRLSNGGRTAGRVPFVAPAAGVVTELGVEEGAMVRPDTVAMSITELDSLWVIAEIPESRSGWVHTGTAAVLTFPAMPGTHVNGEVEYVYPELNPETRTVRARITLASPLASIRPNMLANVSLVGTDGEPALSIPRNAVIRGEAGDHVIIALGEGRFAPRRIVSGRESGEQVAILQGLVEGELVVVAGQFLIDSEANLRAALQRITTEPDQQDVDADDLRHDSRQH